MPFAKTFEGHTEELKKAAEAIGGISVKQGDAGYIIPAFDVFRCSIYFGMETMNFQHRQIFYMITV